MVDLNVMGRTARDAARRLANLSSTEKNRALLGVAAALRERADQILAANERDLAAARTSGLSDAMLDRLTLTQARLDDLAVSVESIVELPDPVGVELDSQLLPNGMRISRRRVPIGVVGVIYEARPNVTVDVSALCFKTGNAAILRGGSETLHSNIALTQAIHAALEEAGVPSLAVQYIDNPDRSLVRELLRLDRYVDMIIPRGGAGLHRLCKEESSIPVITGGIGICHIFVDATADLERAVDIVENAKVQRPSVCNALDTLLVHEAVAEAFLPMVARRLAQRQVEMRATAAAAPLLEADGAQVVPAGEGDFDQEWLSLILGVKTVADIGDAIAHIQAHSTEHSDSILTNDWRHAQRFVNEVNSAAVYVNASTRFTDGGEFGLGAEVAVSTQKLHARGPMGLESLTTYKWIGYGDGHIRE